MNFLCHGETLLGHELIQSSNITKYKIAQMFCFLKVSFELHLIVHFLLELNKLRATKLALKSRND